MKKLKQLLVRTFLFAMVLSMSITMYAGASDTWQNIYEQDFSLFDENSLTNENFPGVKVGYTTEVIDEALRIKSDNVCDWQVRDDSYPSATANGSKGISVTNGKSGGNLKHHDPQYQTVSGSLVDYTGSSTTSWALERIGERDAIRLLSYPGELTEEQKAAAGAKDSWRTNEYRVSIDEGQFDATRTSFDIEIDVYFPEGKRPRFLSFMYTKASGTSTVYLEGTQMTSMPMGEWTTWKFTVNNADFSKIGKFYGSVPANIIITQSNYAYSTVATAYIGRIAVKPSVTGEYVYTPMEKTVKFPFGLGDVYGNTRVSFDMGLPATERYEDLVFYNKDGKNSARISLTNESDDEIAALQIDSNEDGQMLYAITDEDGNEKKELLYEGEILAQTLSYQFDVDWKAKTYTVIIKNANELLDESKEFYGPFTIANNTLVRGNALVRNFEITHNSASESMMTVLDNLLVSYIEDPDYVKCKADAQALTLELPEILLEGFSLPTVGETSGADITWESSNEDVIKIADTGDAAIVIRGAQREEITLTAILDISGVKVLKTFEVKVEKNEDQFKVEADAEAVTIDDIPQNGLIIEDFNLPTTGTVNSSIISWESSNTDVITINPEGNRAIVVRGARQQKVTLTATATINGFTATSDIEVTVCEHDDYLKAKADVQSIVLDIPETGRVKENFTLPSLGTVNSSAITWTTSDAATIAISGNTAQVTRFESNKDVTLTASATLNGFTATREFDLVSPTLRGVSAEIYDVQETVTGGYLSASVDVQYPGKSGTLNFLAVVTDPQTGEILARDIFTKELTNADRYTTVACSVSGLRFEAGNEAKYYIWNEKRESYVNNAPSAVTELSAEGRGKGVRLNWEASIDDNNSVEYYAVYRDGEYIGNAVEETYLDETAEIGAVYDYEVYGVDSNDEFSFSTAAECTPAFSMYYFNFDKFHRGEEDYAYGITYRQSTSGDAYSYIVEVVDANGEKSYAASSDQKWIIGKVDNALLSSDEKNVTFEIDYLDTTGNIQMCYVQVVPQGVEATWQTERNYNVYPVKGMGNTNQWKTASFSITNANFYGSGNWSGSDFGFGGVAKNRMFIKEIRLIQTELYD